MKVEVKIDAKIQEPNVIIHTNKISPEITSIIELIEQSNDQANVLIAKKDDKSFIIEPNDAEIIRTEGGVVTLYNRKGTDFIISKGIAELENTLGNDFIRISKGVLVNINRVDHLSRHFNGTMYIVMKNGVNDYISRSYLNEFKKRLGL